MLFLPFDFFHVCMCLTDGDDIDKEDNGADDNEQ